CDIGASDGRDHRKNPPAPQSWPVHPGGGRQSVDASRPGVRTGSAPANLSTFGPWAEGNRVAAGPDPAPLCSGLFVRKQRLDVAPRLAVIRLQRLLDRLRLV